MTCAPYGTFKRLTVHGRTGGFFWSAVRKPDSHDDENYPTLPIFSLTFFLKSLVCINLFLFLQKFVPAP
jgi:hypothetical protein